MMIFTDFGLVWLSCSFIWIKVLTAVAFSLFAKEKVHFAVIEVDYSSITFMDLI